MSLDFPKRSARKILERIIPPPSGGRDKLRYARFQRVSLESGHHQVKSFFRRVVGQLNERSFFDRGNQINVRA